MLAPNAKLRPLVVPQGPELQEQTREVAVADESEVETVQARPHRISWARMLKRVFDIEQARGGGWPPVVSGATAWALGVAPQDRSP